MKKLIVSLLALIIGFFIVDRCGGRVMFWVHKHSNDISAPKLTHLSEGVDEEIVMLGASRCNLHYVPSVIADTMGKRVYNGGIDGSKNIFSHYFALRMMLRHHVPEIVCLEVMPEDYRESADSYDATTFFAPYIGVDEEADSIFRLAGNYWPYRLSHLYRFNAKAVSNIGGLAVRRNRNEDNGYVPVPKPAIAPSRPDSIHTPDKVDMVKLRYVDKFIALCRENGIRLVFVVSPAYSVPDEDLYDVLKKKSSEAGVPFLDYHTKGLFADRPDFFKDADHLWHEGAVAYSSIFAGDLKRLTFTAICPGHK